MESNGQHENEAMRAHTSQAIQQRIDSSLEERIQFYAMQPREAIERRLTELDQECDVDRTMLMNGAGIALGGVVMSFLGGGRKWLLLSGTVLGYMFMQGLQGWSPPATALRRFGLHERWCGPTTKIGRTTHRLKKGRENSTKLPGQSATGKHG